MYTGSIAEKSGDLYPNTTGPAKKTIKRNKRYRLSIRKTPIKNRFTVKTAIDKEAVIPYCTVGTKVVNKVADIAIHLDKAIYPLSVRNIPNRATKHKGPEIYLGSPPGGGAIVLRLNWIVASKNIIRTDRS